MKRILILYPCTYELEGTSFRRMKSFVKALQERNIELTVLSPFIFPQVKLTYVASWGANCQMRLFPLRASWCPGRFGSFLERCVRRFMPWQKRSYPLFLEDPFYRFGKRVLAEQEIDAIFSSYPACASVAPLIAAKRLASEHNIPFLVDFRDIPGEHGGIPGRDLAKIYDFISRFLSAADLITTVSDDCASLLKRITGRTDVEVIYNGFDAEACNPSSMLPDRETVFRIVHPGNLYDISMNLDIFWTALDCLANRIGSPGDLRVEFYLYDVSGSTSLSHYSKSSRSGSRFVNVCGRIDHSRVLELEKKSAALLLFSYPKAIIDIFPSKGFEYLPVQRPILLIPDDCGLARRLLQETGYFITFRTPYDIADWIEKYYREWKANGGRLRTVQVNQTAIWQYSRQAQAGKMAALVQSALLKKS